MPFKSLRALAFATAAMLPSIAFAQVESREIGPWHFNDSGESCAISMDNDVGAFTMFNQGSGEGAVGFFNKKITGVVDGENAALKIRINGGETVDVTGMGMILEGAAGYLILAPIEAFAENPLGGRFEILRNDQVVHYFMLDNLQPAAQAVVECAKKYKK